MKVDYFFALNDKVKTIFGVFGIVKMLAFDEAGIQYYVATKNNSAWFKEQELSVFDEG